MECTANSCTYGGWFFFGLALYCLISGIAGAIVYNRTHDDASSIGVGVFWPIGGPLALGMYLGNMIARKLP